MIIRKQVKNVTFLSPNSNGRIYGKENFQNEHVSSLISKKKLFLWRDYDRNIENVLGRVLSIDINEQDEMYIEVELFYENDNPFVSQLLKDFCEVSPFGLGVVSGKKPHKVVDYKLEGFFMYTENNFED